MSKVATQPRKVSFPPYCACGAPFRTPTPRHLTRGAVTCVEPTVQVKAHHLSQTQTVWWSVPVCAATQSTYAVLLVLPPVRPVPYGRLDGDETYPSAHQ